MAVRLHEVEVLELRRGGQHDVGVVDGIGREVLEHDREQVVAREAGRDTARVGRDRDRIRVVDDQRVDALEAGAFGTQQIVADGRHVDGARCASREQVGTRQRGAIDTAGAGGRQEDAAGRMPKRPDQRRQAAHVAHGHAATVRPLHAVVDADQRPVAGSCCTPVVGRQRLDVGGLDAAEGRDALRREVGDARLQRREADRVPRHVVVVDPAVADQHVHQTERERAVGAGQQRDMRVALLGRERTIRIDRDQPRPVAPGGLRTTPEMNAGRDRVGAPEHDQLRVLHAFDLGADARTERVVVADRSGFGADVAMEPAGAELVEETAGHRLALDEPHRSRVAVRDDAFGVVGRDCAEPRGDGLECLVPADPREAPLALRADPLQRMQQAIRVIGALDVARHLRAQDPGGRRVVGIAADAQRAAVAHVDQHRAGVRAVVRTGGTHGARRAVVDDRRRNDRARGDRRCGEGVGHDGRGQKQRQRRDGCRRCAA